MLQGEENHTSGQMEADQIIDQAETSPRFNSTEKHTTFYFVKYHRYEDPEITCKIEEACGEIQKKTEEIKYYKEKLKGYEREEESANWRIYSGKDSQMWNTWSIDSKRKCLFNLQNALNKKSTDYRVAMQSLEVKELTNQISDFRHRLQKEKLTLKEQKQLIKQMKELTVERDELVTVESLNSKKKRKEIVKQCEHFKYQKIPMNKWAQAITDEIDGLKAHQIDVRKNVRQWEDYLEDIKSNKTNVLQNMNTAISERDQIEERLFKLKELAAKLNDCYNENDGVRKSAKRIADTKDIETLDELSNNERNFFHDGTAMNLSEMTTPEGYYGHLTVVSSVKMAGYETLTKVLVLHRNIRSLGQELFANKELKESLKEDSRYEFGLIKHLYPTRIYQQ